MGEADGSVTRWISDLKQGEPAAAGPLWDRYFASLVELARGRLRATRRPSVIEDEEDAALSAFHSLCDGAAAGRFARLTDRDDLWRLLVVITTRKVAAQIKHRARLKRGGGRGPASGADGEGDGLDRLSAPEPSPELAAMVAEQCRHLLASLDDDGLRQVALDRLAGYTNDEIAERLGCARRTVTRRLELIRLTWLADAPGGG